MSAKFELFYHGFQMLSIEIILVVIMCFDICPTNYSCWGIKFYMSVNMKWKEISQNATIWFNHGVPCQMWKAWSSMSTEPHWLMFFTCLGKLWSDLITRIEWQFTSHTFVNMPAVYVVLCVIYCTEVLPYPFHILSVAVRDDDSNGEAPAMHLLDKSLQPFILTPCTVRNFTALWDSRTAMLFTF